jgi:hypothetical protein
MSTHSGDSDDDVSDLLHDLIQQTRLVPVRKHSISSVESLSDDDDGVSSVLNTPRCKFDDIEALVGAAETSLQAVTARGGPGSQPGKGCRSVGAMGQWGLWAGVGLWANGGLWAGVMGRHCPQHFTKSANCLHAFHCDSS